MLALLLSLLSFLVGPLLFTTIRQRKAVYGFLDGFVLVGVAGLVLGDILPQAFQSVASASWQVPVLAVAGFFLPFLLERQLGSLPFSPSKLFQGLMVLGLFFHQTLDGMAINGPSPGDGTVFLQLAIVLHQLPKGFLLWSLARPAAGRALATLMILGLSGSTIAGFFLAGTLSGILRSHALWLFQAFVAGGLLHVIVHHVPGERTDLAQRGTAFWSGLGAFLSIAALFALHLTHHQAAHAGEPPSEFQEAFRVLFLESAPSILLGIVAAGALHAFLPKVMGRWFQGRSRISQTLRGIAIGMPLPLCSCGVAPVFLSLVQKGVPTAAAIAFLIATPEIGLDSVFLSWKLLGLKITLIRLALAFLVAMAVGLTISWLMDKRQSRNSLPFEPPLEEAPETITRGGRIIEAARYGGGEIVDEIGIWLIAGLSIAALLKPLAAPDWIANFSRGWDVLVFSALGLPVYVCASGATPFAAALLQKGISVGAVLVFLITGPATNVTTFGILKRTHGLGSAILFAAAVVVFSIAFGFTINWLFPEAAVSVPPLAGESHGWLEAVSAAALLVLFLISLLRRGPRGFLHPLGVIFSGGPSLAAVFGWSRLAPHDHEDRHGHGHEPGHGHIHTPSRSL